MQSFMINLSAKLCLKSSAMTNDARAPGSTAVNGTTGAETDGGKQAAGTVGACQGLRGGALAAIFLLNGARRWGWHACMLLRQLLRQAWPLCSASLTGSCSAAAMDAARCSSEPMMRPACNREFWSRLCIVCETCSHAEEAKCESEGRMITGTKLAPQQDGNAALTSVRRGGSSSPAAAQSSFHFFSAFSPICPSSPRVPLYRNRFRQNSRMSCDQTPSLIFGYERQQLHAGHQCAACGVAEVGKLCSTINPMQVCSCAALL